MRVPVRAGLVVVASAVAACGSVAAPMASGPHAHPGGAQAGSARRGPPAGSWAEAAALARRMLSQLWLPAGARRLPPVPVPRPVRGPALWAGAPAALDVRRLFELRQPMDAVALVLLAHVPAGMSQQAAIPQPVGQPGVTGKEPGVMNGEASYTVRPVPAGVYAAQLVVTVAPNLSGGSWVRADAQVIWYPRRTAAEHIDPGRYHVLAVTVTFADPRQHPVRRVVTSRAAISRLAEALNRSPVQPVLIANCPMDFADYRLAFAVSRHSRPAVVVWATRWPCEGAQIRAGGRMQPPLADEGTVAALADRLLGVTAGP